ncbi:SDR family NAD(P)-dependent oxidoreductase [Alteromonas gilva]|uniref:SDR family oxidoreductase n=1 Tax=Alteromonas gilva TaxID=2987522 RepID=A0ABT5KZC9_9ALTE|nr:SDR family oxidoreductase [Alteromonas gilva]MDC8830129.1 SDR family oxidoreductase [Alteromonas gilva]
MGRFSNKVAIISGAGSGIGAAIAARFCAEDIAGLVLLDKHAAGLQATAEDLPANTKVISRVLDVADEAAVVDAVEATFDTFGRIDVLCNNAGIACSRKLADEQDLTEWQQVMAVNVYSCVALTSHVARYMGQQPSGGAIVNTASVAGLRSGAGGNAYSASKAAVINFTQTAACDLASKHIRVNAVCPGLIETGMTSPFFAIAREKGVEHRLGERCELKRAGQPQEVAAAIAFLASDDASYITGQALAVDGGNSASLNMPGMKV